MSDDYEGAAGDPQAEMLVQEFRQLSPEDQGLVLALVIRLRGSEQPEYPRDVPFMDFDE